MGLAAMLRAGCCAMLLAAGSALAQPAPVPPPPGSNKPLRPAAPKPATPTAKTGEACEAAPQMTAQEVVRAINGYFNSFTYLTADFVQLNTDGRRYKGQLYVQRPGKLRFDYDDPKPTEIVSDGSTVVVRNRKLATQDVYGIGQTPLKFLLKDRLDLSTDTTLVGGSRECDQLVLAVEDRGTITGTARIRLVLKAEPLTLRQWTISDANGNETVVQLSNVDHTRRPDPKLFTVDTTRVLDPK